MKKKTPQDIAKKALDKKFLSLVPDLEAQENAAWFVDEETPQSYTWSFELNGTVTCLVYGMSYDYGLLV